MNRFFWMVRREIWEHKAIWVAPAIVLGCFVMLLVFGKVHLGPFDMNGMPLANVTPEQKVTMLMYAYSALALVMAIDAKLLVLDEPTLGLDILMRKQFYETLLNEYFDEQRTILVTTHQVEEIEHILTDLLFIDRGRIVLDASMEEVQDGYAQVAIRPEHVAAARTLKPVAERQGLGRTHMLFKGADRAELERLGEVGVPSVADLFVAVIQGARS